MKVRRILHLVTRETITLSLNPLDFAEIAPRCCLRLLLAATLSLSLSCDASSKAPPLCPTRTVVHWHRQRLDVKYLLLLHSNKQKTSKNGLRRTKISRVTLLLYHPWMWWLRLGYRLLSTRFYTCLPMLACWCSHFCCGKCWAWDIFFLAFVRYASPILNDDDDDDQPPIPFRLCSHRPLRLSLFPRLCTFASLPWRAIDKNSTN